MKGKAGGILRQVLLIALFVFLGLLFVMAWLNK